MRTALRRAAPAVIAAVVIATAPAPATASAGTGPGRTYYVDAVTGDDSAGGRLPGDAWKSLDKVNALTLGPRDTVRFRAGQRWHGRLRPNGAGAPGSPVTVTSYGTGAKPVIDGGGRVDSAVLLENVHDFVLEGIEVTNWSGATDVYRSGVHLHGRDAGELAGITLRDLTIRRVDGKGGTSVGKAGLIASITGNRVPTYFKNLTIERNEISDVRSYGMLLWSSWSKRNGMTSFYPSETGIQDGELGPWTPSEGVVIRGNHVHDVTAGGIAPMHLAGGLVEGNRVDRAVTGRLVPNGGNVGIWWQGTDDLVVQHNEVSRTGFNGPGSDGHGFDADADNNRSLVQYNHSHGNDGGFFISVSFAGAPTRDTTVRYNVSHDDGYETFGISTATTGTHIHNNTVHTTSRVVVVPPPYKGEGSYPLGRVVRLYDDAANVTVRNNVFLNAAGAGFDTRNGVVYDHNLYAGTARPPTGNDHAPIEADPKLAAPGDGSLDGYRPLPGSPALDAGVTVPATHDIAGVPVPDAAPDLGAFQRRVAAPRVSGDLSPQGGLGRLADGDPATYWQSVPKPRLPAAIDLAYPVARTFSALSVLTPRTGRAVTGAAVRTWDGSAWTAVPGEWKDGTFTPAAPVTAERVRLVLTSASGGGSLRISEVRLEVPAATGPFEAPWTGPLVTSSFPSSPSTPWTNLVDGDPNSAWSTVADGLAFPGDITLDLREPREVSTVTLHTGWALGQGVSDVSLQTWDGAAWTDRIEHLPIAWQHNSGVVETATLALPAPVTTRKIRLVVHAAHLQWGNLALYEVVVA